jgi:maleylacetate reductase
MLHGTFHYPNMERVIYGVPFALALAAEIEAAEASRVYVLSSGTLARETDTMEQIRQVLGNRLAGVCDKIGAHTPRVDVLAAANAARAAGADLLLTVGGGSVTDAAKMVGICLGNDITEPNQLGRLAATTHPDGTTTRPPTAPPPIRTVTIPTTLSAGEFSAHAGCTDTSGERHVKESFAQPFSIPRTVILDPALTVHTPEWLFLSTGIRAVDHAVETICSISPQPFPDATALHALRLLSSGLRGVKQDPRNLPARLDCQLGAWMSMTGVSAGVPLGASHGIGHVLGGTAGMPHGYTSCVMLPHVMRFNHAVNAARQTWVADALGHTGVPAAELLANLIADLGMPGTLRAAGMRAEMLAPVAERSMHDRWIRTNPNHIEGPATVRNLLDAAW